ncbi:MAG TPA: hypothetical protein VN181_14335 [Thermoanaerobaculia bacterium]|nr:hypothetical protein [Thermoanaerobaculia bacterium]
MRTILFFFLTIAMSAHAADPFAKVLAEVRNGDDFAENCGDEVDPQSVVCRAAGTSLSAEDVAKEITRGLGVTNESARAIGFASLALMKAGFNAKLDDATSHAVQNALAGAAKRETHRLPLLIVMAQVGAYDALLPLVQEESDPVQTAITISEHVASNESLAVLLADAFTRHPDNTALINAIGERSPVVVMRAAFGPLAISEPGATLRMKNSEHLNEQLDALAQLGLADTVIAAFHTLPANVRAILSDDVRRDVAASALITRNPQLAREILPAEPQPLLAFALSDGRGDFFDVITAMPSSIGVHGQLYAMLLERHGYPALAAEVLHDSEWARASYGYEIPPAFRETVAPLQHLVDDAAATEHSRAALLAPPAQHSKSLLRLINTPRIVPFSEHALAEAEVGVARPTIIDCSDVASVAVATHLPPHVSPVRMERHDNDVVVVAISPAVDPIGELGLGGYWILRSRDGGQTWSRYFTGLRENAPYVIPPASTLPILDGDHLRIEVEVQEIDTESITFPPIGLRIARSQKGLYLDFAWDALTRDSDRDGMTDLLEERIVTDPNDPDTDGDGIADGADALPQVAFGGVRTPTAEILAAVLDGFNLGEGRIVEGVSAPPDTVCQVRTSNIGDATLFLIGDRAQFAPLTMSGRAIIFSGDEIEAYAKKFGPTYAGRINHFVIDHTGTRAILNVDQSWTGTTYKLTKRENGWTVEVLSSWIT